MKEPAYLDQISVRVKETLFLDGKNTTKDTCLLGPPMLEFAPFQKVPGGRTRHDGRQGTIDQDQEFIDFLQSLTEPVTKPSTNGVEAGTKEAVTTTPLVQYIKEKKAAKSKEAAAAKTSKAEKAKAAKVEAKATVVVKSAKPSASEKDRLAKATQDTVQKIAAMTNKPQPAKTDTKTAVAKSETSATAPAKKERTRGDASVAARMLQRDLGLTPKEPKRREKVAPAPAPQADDEKQPNVVPPFNKPSVQAKPVPSTTPPTGPRSTRGSSGPAKQIPAPQRPAKAGPLLSADAKSAFLKHANPSQGVTEELLRSEFEKFGKLSRCSIDRKKGFGYVDFLEPEGLRLAMQASPVKVGNGQVQVLENKVRLQPKHDLPSAPASGPSSPALNAARPLSQPKPASESIKATALTSQPPATTPPTAPKASTQPTVTTTASRGGHVNSNRASRSQTGPGRGSFSPGNRGGPRAGFRGNGPTTRGNLPFHPRGGGRGSAGAESTSTNITANVSTTTKKSTVPPPPPSNPGEPAV